MKILGIVGSNRKKGNSYLLLQEMSRNLPEIEVKIIQAAELKIKPCLLVTVSASGSSFNAFQILHHLQEFALMLHLQPLTINFWPYIGFSAKGGNIDKGSILKETEVIEKAKEVMGLKESCKSKSFSLEVINYVIIN